MNWFYESGGQQQGPVDDDDLDRLLAEGKIRPETLIWREGLADWQPLRTARPAPGTPNAEGLTRCGSCGQFFPGADLVQIGGRAICPACKPAVLLGLQQGALLPTDEEGRDGPAWEKREALGLVPAIGQTIRAALTEPGFTFTRMRRQGGLGTPFLYFLIVGTFCLAVNYFVEGIIRLNLPLNSLPPAFRQIMTDQGGMGRVILMVCLSPLIAAIIPFVGAGILHLCLMLCRGARQPFETTFRVYCYCVGSAAVLQIIPICGALVALVWGIVAQSIGLARAHEISTGKAVLAVLLPLILACGIVFIFAIVAGILAASVKHRLGV